jgi:choice-of-anchor A domain-containing protein
VVCACLIPAIFADSHAQDLSALSEYSVITRGNFSTNSDVEGRTLVGGDFTGKSSANFGIRLQNRVSKDDLVVRIAGDLVSGNPLNVNAGSVELGGSRNGRPINFNGGGSLISNPAADYSLIIKNLDLASSLLQSYGANSQALFIQNGQPGPYKFEAKPDVNGLAVFDIHADDLFGNSKVQQIELIANGATQFLINVQGTDIRWSGGNMVGLFTQNAIREALIWNFYEAEKIDFGSRNMMGQVLAPLAAVTASGNLDGSIFADTFATTSEVHLPGYNNKMVLIPEPSSALLLMLGGLLLGLRRR